ncbi:MAG: diguanylate cyclase domain-containing protein [Erysipelotrichaceae bacterium]
MQLYNTTHFIRLLEDWSQPTDVSKEINHILPLIEASLLEADLTLENKAARLYALGLHALKSSDFPKAEHLLGESLTIAIDKKLPILEGKCRLKLSECAYLQHDVEPLRTSAAIIRELFLQQHDYESLAYYYLEVLRISRLELTDLHFHELLAYAIKYTNLNKTERNTQFYIALAMQSDMMSKDYIRSIFFYLEAKKWAIQVNNGPMISYIDFFIGKMFFNIQRFYQAIQYFKRAISQTGYEQLSFRMRFYPRIFIAACMVELSNYQEAKELVQSLYEIAETADQDEQMYHVMLTGIAAEIALRTNQDLAGAAEKIEYCYASYQKNPSNYLVDFYRQICILRYGDLYFKKEDFAYALHYYKQIITLEDSTAWHRKDAFERLALTYEALGDYNQSLRMYQKAFEANEQIDLANDTKRYNLNFDQFLAQNDRFFYQLTKEESIKLEPYIDSETSLYNESLLHSYINFHNETVLRKAIPLTVLHCDVDYFNNYRDFYGEQEASNVLKLIGKMILHTVNDYTTKVIHLPGDDFLVLLEDVTIEQAQTIAHQLLLNLERMEIIHEVSPISEIVSMCIGIASENSKSLANYHSILESAFDAVKAIKDTTTKTNIAKVN